MFILLKNYASAGASKGENLELISMAFKVKCRTLLNYSYFTEGKKSFKNLSDATLFIWIFKVCFLRDNFAFSIYISNIISSACKIDVKKVFWFWKHLKFLSVFYLQAVTVLVRDVKIYKLEQTQLQVLLTFCEEDLYDYNRQSTAFSLLKVRCYWQDSWNV